MPLTAPDDYLELTLAVEGEQAEIWMARLAEAGFESFVEEDHQLKAYTVAADDLEEHVQLLIEAVEDLVPVMSGYRIIPAQNWNQTWEENFQPVVIAGKLQVRARHHQPDEEAAIQILIEPKMSFGTGHHATTSQVAAFQLEIDHSGATVIDAGSGTGILAILAEKLGAERVLAFDHEEWACENARENAEMNDCQRISVEQADLESYEPGLMADGVLANITRNLVIEYLPRFAQWLKPGGWLLTSGFYEEDLPAVQAAADAAGLGFVVHTVLDRWCAARFGKPADDTLGVP